MLDSACDGGGFDDDTLGAMQVTAGQADSLLTDAADRKRIHSIPGAGMGDEQFDMVAMPVHDTLIKGDGGQRYT